MNFQTNTVIIFLFGISDDIIIRTTEDLTKKRLWILLKLTTCPEFKATKIGNTPRMHLIVIPPYMCAFFFVMDFA